MPIFIQLFFELFSLVSFLILSAFLFSSSGQFKLFELPGSVLCQLLMFKFSFVNFYFWLIALFF